MLTAEFVATEYDPHVVVVAFVVVVPVLVCVAHGSDDHTGAPPETESTCPVDPIPSRASTPPARVYKSPLVVRGETEPAAVGSHREVLLFHA
jgi:hypothetical protein